MILFLVQQKIRAVRIFLIRLATVQKDLSAAIVRLSLLGLLGCFSYHSRLYINLIFVLATCFSTALANTANGVIKYVHNPPYNSLPITPKTWEEVDLIDYSMINGHRYANATQLLRPIGWLHKRHMDTIGSQVLLSLPEFGIVNVTATITDIKPTYIDTQGINWSRQEKVPVIGKFIRHVTDVRTYVFKDNQGDLSHINATPNHPFYIKNKHEFVPIRNVNDKDKLVGVSDGYKDMAYLVCTHGKHVQCGVPYINGSHIAVVYNLEMYKRHTYHVGGNNILVHNVCDLSTGIYKLQLEKLKSPKFTPRIGSDSDDSALYSFGFAQSLTDEEYETLWDWAESRHQFSYETGTLAHESSALSDMMLDKEPYISDKIYSYVYRQDKLLGISLFSINETSADIEFTVSDPVNLAATKPIRGFGARLKYVGIEGVRSEFPSVLSISSRAGTLPSAKSNLNLGFDFISPFE